MSVLSALTANTSSLPASVAHYIRSGYDNLPSIERIRQLAPSAIATGIGLYYGTLNHEQLGLFSFPYAVATTALISTASLVALNMSPRARAKAAIASAIGAFTQAPLLPVMGSAVLTCNPNNKKTEATLKEVTTITHAALIASSLPHLFLRPSSYTLLEASANLTLGFATTALTTRTLPLALQKTQQWTQYPNHLLKQAWKHRVLSEGALGLTLLSAAGYGLADPTTLTLAAATGLGWATYHFSSLKEKTANAYHAIQSQLIRRTPAPIPLQTPRSVVIAGGVALSSSLARELTKADSSEELGLALPLLGAIGLVTGTRLAWSVYQARSNTAATTTPSPASTQETQTPPPSEGEASDKEEEPETLASRATSTPPRQLFSSSPSLLGNNAMSLQSVHSLKGNTGLRCGIPLPLDWMRENPGESSPPRNPTAYTPSERSLQLAEKQVEEEEEEDRSETSSTHSHPLSGNTTAGQGSPPSPDLRTLSEMRSHTPPATVSTARGEGQPYLGRRESVLSPQPARLSLPPPASQGPQKNFPQVVRRNPRVASRSFGNRTPRGQEMDVVDPALPPAAHPQPPKSPSVWDQLKGAFRGKR